MSDFDLIIRGSSVVRPEGVAKLDVGIKDGQITAGRQCRLRQYGGRSRCNGFSSAPRIDRSERAFQRTGARRREGFEHGSRALAAGGYTSFFDMPLYAKPAVVDKNGFLAKWNCGKADSLLDFGLWGGLTPDSLEHMQELTACGVIGSKPTCAPAGSTSLPSRTMPRCSKACGARSTWNRLSPCTRKMMRSPNGLPRVAIAEGRLTARDYLASRPVIAELEAIQRRHPFRLGNGLFGPHRARQHGTGRGVGGERQGPGSEHQL